jgi:hypothetical protein
MLLQRPYCRRAGLRVAAVDRPADFVRAVTCALPDVAIWPVGALAPLEERALVRALAAPRARTGRPLLLLGVPADRDEVGTDLSMCDGTVSLEDPEPDLRRFLTRRLAVPIRGEARTPAELPALLYPWAGRAAFATAEDLSAGGACLRVASPAASDRLFRAVFTRGDDRSVGVTVRRVWQGASDGHSARVGVRFVDATPRDRGGLRDLGFWWVEGSGVDEVVQVQGDITSSTSFATLGRAARDGLTLDLGRVGTVTVGGAVAWLDFLGAVAPRRGVRLRRVPTLLRRAFLDAPLCQERCTVESYLTPYECERCGLETTVLERAGEKPPPVACAACRAPLVPLVGGRPHGRRRSAGAATGAAGAARVHGSLARRP